MTHRPDYIELIAIVARVARWLLRLFHVIK